MEELPPIKINIPRNNMYIVGDFIWKGICWACLVPVFLSLFMDSSLAGPLPAADVQRVEKYFAGHMSSRYMEQNCQKSAYPGWEGFPTQLCKYTVKDKNGRTKSAQVLLLDASANKLATWIVSTCLKIKGNANSPCTSKLSRKVIEQSGGQFPVAGIVYEDLNEDGINEVYVFRNGVTVSVNGIKNGSTQQPTSQQINNSLNGGVESTFKFARIVGTTREDYKSFGGKQDVEGNKWLKVVKDLYHKAFNSDTNDLMIMWAKHNI